MLVEKYKITAILKRYVEEMEQGYWAYSNLGIPEEFIEDVVDDIVKELSNSNNKESSK